MAASRWCATALPAPTARSTRAPVQPRAERRRCCAQAAMVGFLVHINHIHFPGMLSPTEGVSFAQLSAMGPFDAWNAVRAPTAAPPPRPTVRSKCAPSLLTLVVHVAQVPLLGKAQVIWTIGGLEHASECLDPAGHYTKGGTPGDLKFLKNFWDTPGFTKRLTEAQKVRANNRRRPRMPPPDRPPGIAMRSRRSHRRISPPRARRLAG